MSELAPCPQGPPHPQTGDEQLEACAWGCDSPHASSVCRLALEMLPLPGSLLAPRTRLTMSLPGASDPGLSSKGTNAAALRWRPLPAKVWASHSNLSTTIAWGHLSCLT